MGGGTRDYERINVETELDHLLSLRFGESSPSGIAGLSNFELSGEEEHRRALMTEKGLSETLVKDKERSEANSGQEKVRVCMLIK